MSEASHNHLTFTVQLQFAHLLVDEQTYMKLCHIHFM